MREFLERPSQMKFWGNPENLQQFLIIQATMYESAGSSGIAYALWNAVTEITIQLEKDKSKNGI